MPEPFPLSDTLFQALTESLNELRNEVENPRYGPIENDEGTILFGFRGKQYTAPEPQAVLFGHDPKADQSICLRAILDRSATIVG